VSLGELLRSGGPRFVRDSAGPVLAFYAGFRLAGLVTGIALATAFAIGIFFWERRHERSGAAATTGLVIALAQAAAGLATGSAVAYFAPGVLVNAALGVGFLGSVAIGRPLAGVFAQDMHAFPAVITASRTFRRVFGQISVAWGAYLLARSALRLVVLVWASVDLFVLVNIVTGLPLTFALMTWSFWYGRRRLLASEEVRALLGG
jgi:Protein of unknown function (DUF3159)